MFNMHLRLNICRTLGWGYLLIKDRILLALERQQKCWEQNFSCLQIFHISRICWRKNG